MTAEYPWDAADRIRTAIDRNPDGGADCLVPLDDLRVLLDCTVYSVPEFGADELRSMAWLDYIIDQHVHPDARGRVLRWLNDRWPDAQPAAEV